MMPSTILDRPQVLNVLFYPRQQTGLPYSTMERRDIQIEVGEGISLGGRLYPAGKDAPVILYFHGNGEIAADYDDIALFYRQESITLLVVDYRGYGRSGGSPTAGSLLADAVTSFAALERILSENRLSPVHRYVMGRSLGSAAAIEVAMHAGDRLAGMIIESGFAHTFGLLSRLGINIEDADEERDGFGNLSKIKRLSLPILVIHGLEDRLIPPSEGRTLYETCAAHHKQLVMIPGAGHNDLLFRGRELYFQAVREFIQR
jgi:alpha-beta hydrolase superfamily lysophospholipase